MSSETDSPKPTSQPDHPQNFIKYWYFRYLMVTELYMVEKWERVTIHILLATLFLLFWLFNASVLLSITGKLLGVPAIPKIEDFTGSDETDFLSRDNQT